MSWSAAQYSKFEAERNRPIQDLLARIPSINVRRAADLGCGPGNSTQLLGAHFPDAALIGIDRSAEMIQAASRRLPAIRFEIQEIGTWSDPGPFDVILANASLQWVPDHLSVLPALLRKLAPGGSLAVQVPDNLEEPAHRLMREIASTGPWSRLIGQASRSRGHLHSPENYFRELKKHAGSVDVWRTTYHHHLAGGADAIVEWFKGTGLRPFLDPLSNEDRMLYLDRYRSALAGVYPSFADGSVLLPFPRLFIVATV